MKAVTRIQLLLGFTAAAAFVMATPARASTFSVNPVQIYLSPKTPNVLLTLRNDSDQTLRFQLSAVSWDQTPQEQMLFSPTTDLIFYPPLVTLAAREERKIRVGVATAFGAVEKTYRIFVEELPHLAKPGEQSSGVTVLTKMGIPVFLEATRASTQVVIDEAGVHGGRITFQIRNSGNTHFVAEHISVRAMGIAGDVLLARQLQGWYVLAGRARAYDIAVPEGDCARIASATVEVQIGRSVIKERLGAVASACTP